MERLQDMSKDDLRIADSILRAALYNKFYKESIVLKSLNRRLNNYRDMTEEQVAHLSKRLEHHENRIKQQVEELSIRTVMEYLLKG